MLLTKNTTYILNPQLTVEQNLEQWKPLVNNFFNVIGRRLTVADNGRKQATTNHTSYVQLPDAAARQHRRETTQRERNYGNNKHKV